VPGTLASRVVESSARFNTFSLPDMNRTWKASLATLLTLVAAVVALLPAGAAAWGSPWKDEPGDSAPAADKYILRLQRDEAAVQSAQAQADTLATQRPPAESTLAQVVFKLEQDNAAYRYREAIRHQQVDLLEVASQTEVADAVIRAAPPELAVVVGDAVGAWRSIWHLAGIDEYNLVRIHPRPLGSAAPSGTLSGYYQASASHYQIDWTFLASINFIESDFGRVNGPSSAGALGPMQFMPATWTAYGGGGDVNNPKDAIDAAARYLFLSGGRRSMDTALFAYNHDNDYVAAVNYYADVIRHDPAWLDRLYYWNTFG
jgi:membrane-bound lytic murein transglycosylase B